MLLAALFMVSSEVLAGLIPEPTPGLPEDESIAYQPRTTPTIDGDLSDWENAAFKAIDTLPNTSVARGIYSCRRRTEQ